MREKEERKQKEINKHKGDERGTKEKKNKN